MADSKNAITHFNRGRTMYEVINYTTASGRDLVQDHMKRLAAQHKVNEVVTIRSYVEQLSEFGLKLEDIKPTSIKSLHNNGLYELRPKNNRIIFFCFEQNKIVLLHAFSKKTRKTPQPEIVNAINEKRDYERRHRHE